METLFNQIKKALQEAIELEKENKLESLSYATSHNGEPLKIKYYEQDFQFCPWLDKKDFYWDSKEKCYYKKKDGEDYEDK